MVSSVIHRLWAIIPANSQQAANAWIHANFDTVGGNWFTNGLSLSGTAPATAYWVNVGLTDSDLTTLLNYFCGMFSVSLPSDWSIYSQENKQAWVSLNCTKINGFTLLLDNNLGVWTDPSVVLQSTALQVIQEGI